MYSDTVIRDELPTLLTLITPHIKGPIIAWHAEPVSSGISTRILLIYNDVLYYGSKSRMEAYIKKDGTVFSYSFLETLIPVLEAWSSIIGEKCRQIERTEKFKKELILKTEPLIDGLVQLGFD
jgi:hypothetical protein